MTSIALKSDTSDIHFVLREWLQIEKLNRFGRYKDFDADTLDLLVSEGMKFAKEVVAPTMVESDRVGCRVENGRVVVPECMREPYRLAYELGWASLTSSREWGGQGAPLSVGIAVKERLIAANLPLFGIFGLTESAAHLIETHGTEELRQTYVSKMVSGRYSGTGCLSEPHAGSDVGAVSTMAVPTSDGRYKIKGTKCWISGGDHNLSENIIHTVLARIQGAPRGVKGLSLFLVPAFHVNEDGTMGTNNDVILQSIEHKMGLNGSPTCVLNFGENDNCFGYLLGKEHQGISHMFQSMNEARMMTATMGLGGAMFAYQNALAYAKERVQGRSISSKYTPDSPRVAIIEHPDVRLNLAHMKSQLEAIRALLYGTTHFSDIAVATSDEHERAEAEDLIQILTPMCKAWSTEVAIDVIRTGMQILGGVGYTKDFPMEQCYRDFRVAAVFEGTTGIQALDLVCRKITMRDGALFSRLQKLFSHFAETHSQHPVLGPTIRSWFASCERVATLATGMQLMMKERGMAGAVLYATPFMMFFSAMTAGYFYLQQGVVAADRKKTMASKNTRFYDNKIKSVRFYVDVVLPAFEAPATAIERKNYDALDLEF